MISGYLKYLYNRTAILSGKKLNELVEIQPNARLLDLGCWDGINTMQFARKIKTRNVFGIELVKKKADEAKKRGVKVYVGDLNDKFPVPSKSVDVAIGYHVIEHLVNTKQFVKEIYRVLDDNGYAIIGTPNLASWHNVFALIIGVQPFSGPHVQDNYHGEVNTITQINADRMEKVFKKSKTQEGGSLRHLVVLTTRALKKLFRNTGFEIEGIYGFGYYPLPGPLDRLSAKIDPNHSHYIIIKARKPGKKTKKTN